MRGTAQAEHFGNRAGEARLDTCAGEVVDIPG